jgi:hypothetical protein
MKITRARRLPPGQLRRLATGGWRPVLVARRLRHAHGMAKGGDGRSTHDDARFRFVAPPFRMWWPNPHPTRRDAIGITSPMQNGSIVRPGNLAVPAPPPPLILHYLITNSITLTNLLAIPSTSSR